MFVVRGLYLCFYFSKTKRLCCRCWALPWNDYKKSGLKTKDLILWGFGLQRDDTFFLSFISKLKFGTPYDLESA